MTVPGSFRSQPPSVRRFVSVMGVVLATACQNGGSSGDGGGNGGGSNEPRTGSESGESREKSEEKKGDDRPDGASHAQGEVSSSEAIVFTTGHQGRKRLFVAVSQGAEAKRPWHVQQVSFPDNLRFFGDAALAAPTGRGFARVVVGMDRRSELGAPQGRRFGVFAWQGDTFGSHLLPRQARPGGSPPHIASADSASAAFAAVGRRGGRTGILVGRKVPEASAPQLPLMHKLENGSRISHLKLRHNGTGGHTLAWLDRGTLRFRRFGESGWQGQAVEVADSQCQTITTMDVSYMADGERLQVVYSCTAREGAKTQCLIRAAPWKAKGEGFAPVTVTVADPKSSCQPFRSHAPAVAQGAQGSTGAVVLVRAGDAADPRWDLAWARKEKDRSWRTTTFSHEKAQDVTGYPFLSSLGSRKFRLVFLKAGEIHTVTVAAGSITAGSKSGTESPVTAILDYRGTQGNTGTMEQ